MCIDTCVHKGTRIHTHMHTYTHIQSMQRCILRVVRVWYTRHTHTNAYAYIHLQEYMHTHAGAPWSRSEYSTLAHRLRTLAHRSGALSGACRVERFQRIPSRDYGAYHRETMAHTIERLWHIPSRDYDKYLECIHLMSILSLPQSRMDDLSRDMYVISVICSHVFLHLFVFACTWICVQIRIKDRFSKSMHMYVYV